MVNCLTSKYHVDLIVLCLTAGLPLGCGGRTGLSAEGFQTTGATSVANGGGMFATGGKSNTGETFATGGHRASGGVPASGGKSNSGGVPASGGKNTSGGAIATGGTAASGGNGNCGTGCPSTMTCNNGTCEVTLCRGQTALGGLPLLESTEGITRIFASDLNQDGGLDLIALSASAGVISVQLNAGNGTFTRLPDLALSDYTQALAVEDLNKDGFPDLVTVGGSLDNVLVRLGDGHGTFLPPTSFSTSSYPNEMLTADVDNDGNLDIVVTTGHYPRYYADVLLGLGDGTFETHLDTTLDDCARTFDIGDLDGDGAPDLAIVLCTSDTVRVLLGKGDGQFVAVADYATGSRPVSIGIADINQDGRLDIVTGNMGATEQGMSVLLNLGNGGFATNTDYATPRLYGAIRLADLDNDHVPDIVAGISDSTSQLSVLWGVGGGNLSRAEAVPSLYAATALTVGDFTGDGRLDIATASGSNIDVIANQNNRTFLTRRDYPAGKYPTAIQLADMNTDGVTDWLTLNRDEDSPTVALGMGDGTFGLPVNRGLGHFPRSMAIGDWNTDGSLDLAVANTTSNSVSTLLGTPSGFFYRGVDYTLAADPDHLVLQDFNRDGSLDLLAMSGSGKNYILTVLTGDGKGALVSEISFGTRNNPSALAVQDVNRDGLLDVVEAYESQNAVGVTLGDAARLFMSEVDYPTGNAPAALALADVNRDQTLDIVVLDSSSFSMSLLFGFGDGTFGAPQTTTFDWQPTSVAAGDINGDQLADLAVTGPQFVAISWGIAPGKFHTPIRYATGASANSVVIRDLDGDGRVDLALLNSSEDTVGILPQSCVSLPF